MNKTIWIILGLILIALGVWGFVRDSGEPTSEEPIKIGAALSLSGIASQDGESIKEGLELAKSDLEKKGIDIELVYQDDGTDPKDTISAINALVLQDVRAIIGPTWSYLADAGVPVVDQLKIVSMMPANTSEYVGAKSDFAFYTAAKLKNIVPVLTKWLEDNNKKRVAIIRNTGGAWYEVVGETVKAAVINSGGEVVFEETLIFGSEADTLPTIIAKLKKIETDLIFTEIDDDQGLFIMFKKLQEHKDVTDIMSVTTALNRVLDENNLNLNLNNNVYALVPESSADFDSLFEDFYNKKPGAYADSAYDSLMILVEAIQNKGDTPLEKYLRDITNYEGYAGLYNFDESGDVQDRVWTIKNI